MGMRAIGALLWVAVSISCQAQGTQLWKQSRAEDFEKGTSHGVAIRNDGLLALAPATRLITTSSSTYIWGTAVDQQGNALLAAGSPARLYRVAPDGKTTTLFEGKELQAQTVLSAANGDIFFATSPDGRVYKISAPVPAGKNVAPAPSSQPAVFFEPKTKYIWALALDPSGNLYVATGDNGEIYRVDASGKGSIFFKTDEAHLRSLAFDLQGNLIAGSDGSGLVYRITQQGQAFVLFSAPKKEVTSLAVDAQGNIYAASVGDKRSASPAKSTTAPGAGATSAPAAASGGSEVDMIAPDGLPSRLWSSHEDLVYTLAFDSHDQLLIGTGNRGRIYAVSRTAPAGQYTNLVSLSANQVTAFASAPNHDILAATSNLGKLIAISSQQPAEGTFESDVFDAKTFARWGRVETHGHGKYEVALRTGNVDNPDRNWSNWIKVDLTGNTPPDVPAARFAQWRTTLSPGAEIDSVAVNYHPKNVAPIVDEITVTLSPRIPASSAPATPASPTAPSGEITVKWTSHDDNNDELRYSVFYRGTGEKRWKLLRADLKEKQVVLDPSLFPDGEYQVRIVATDAPSHSPEDALTGDRVSSYFEVDSTQPRIDALQAVFDEGALHISFRATDPYSPIKRAEYSIDAGEWQLIEPVGGISDAKTESYDFDVLVNPGTQRAPEENAVPSSGRKKRGKVKPPVVPAGPEEHLIVVRVYDRFDNAATAKSVVNGDASANAQR